MTAVPTVLVTVLASGHTCLINVEDFDPVVHRRVEEVSAPATPTTHGAADLGPASDSTPAGVGSEAPSPPDPEQEAPMATRRTPGPVQPYEPVPQPAPPPTTGAPPAKATPKPKPPSKPPKRGR